MALIKCPGCGNEVKENVNFCPNCGAKMGQENTDSVKQSQEENNTNNNDNVLQTKPKKKNNAIKIVVAIVVVVAVGFAAFQFVIGRNTNKYMELSQKLYDEISDGNLRTLSDVNEIAYSSDNVITYGYVRNYADTLFSASIAEEKEQMEEVEEIYQEINEIGMTKNNISDLKEKVETLYSTYKTQYENVVEKQGVMPMIAGNKYRSPVSEAAHEVGIELVRIGYVKNEPVAIIKPADED